MFESAGGDFGAWLGNLFGGSQGTGWGSAPGMAEAGYGLAPGVSEGTSFGNALNNISSKGLTDALGGMAKGAGGGAAAAAGKGPLMPGQGGGVAVGRPSSAQNLATLLQILNNRRDTLFNSATGGVGAGQVPQQRPTAGLLGF